MIKEQGPKNYEAMRARVDARVEIEVTTPADVGRAAVADAMFAKLAAANGHGPNRSVVEGGAILPGATADRVAPPTFAPIVADVENDGDRGGRSRAPKPFPMPGTRWVWRGDEQATTPTGPHQVESLRWFAGAVEAMFVADPRYPGYACAGVDHMMRLDAWECIGGVFALPDHRLAAAAIGLDRASLRLLTWIASQLPATRLRTACEEATARGWVRPDARHVEVPVGPEDRARAELLGVVRTIEGLLFRDAEGKPAVTPRRSREEVLADAAARGGAK